MKYDVSRVTERFRAAARIRHWSRRLLAFAVDSLTRRRNPCQRGWIVARRCVVGSSTGPARAAVSTIRARLRSGPRRAARPSGDLSGRTCLVTGASGGLGATIARRFRLEGARLVLSGRRLEELSSLATELGAEATVVGADLALLDDVQRLASQSGPVDVLVANAGLPANGELADLDVEDIARAVDINVRSTLLLTRLLLPRMLDQGSGHIVIIGSLAGLAPTPR